MAISKPRSRSKKELESQMNRAWLRCTVESGMFSRERLVKVKTASGDSAAFFVPTDKVSESEKEVMVSVLRAKGNTVVFLPTHYNAQVVVRAEDLTLI